MYFGIRIRVEIIVFSYIYIICSLQTLNETQFKGRRQKEEFKFDYEHKNDTIECTEGIIFFDNLFFEIYQSHNVLLYIYVTDKNLERQNAF